MCIRDSLWIVVGQPDERWLRKASGRSERVVVFPYGDRVVDVWWEQNRPTLEKLPNLTIFRVSSEDTQALAALANRAMSLQCLIPVSYTHLDVYKRQAMSVSCVTRTIVMPSSLSSLNSAMTSSLVSVSYTHLDVYKRQG